MAFIKISKLLKRLICLLYQVYDVKGIDMGNGLVRYKAEIDFDGRELARSYLERSHISWSLYKWSLMIILCIYKATCSFAFLSLNVLIVGKIWRWFWKKASRLKTRRKWRWLSKSILSGWKFIRSKNLFKRFSCQAFLLKHGENMVDCLGAEVDRIEKNLKQKHPEVFWQILYIYSHICSFERDLVFTIHTKNLWENHAYHTS